MDKMPHVFDFKTVGICHAIIAVIETCKFLE